MTLQSRVQLAQPLKHSPSAHYGEAGAGVVTMLSPAKTILQGEGMSESPSMVWITELLPGQCVHCPL